MSGSDPAINGLPRFAIDRNSPVPLYFQVAQHLEDAINSGALPTGTLLQNEVDLAAVPRPVTADHAPGDAAPRRQGPGDASPGHRHARRAAQAATTTRADQPVRRPEPRRQEADHRGAVLRDGRRRGGRRRRTRGPRGDAGPRARATPQRRGRADREDDELPARATGPVRRGRPGRPRPLRPDPPAGDLAALGHPDAGRAHRHRGRVAAARGEPRRCADHRDPRSPTTTTARPSSSAATSTPRAATPSRSTCSPESRCCGARSRR